MAHGSSPRKAPPCGRALPQGSRSAPHELRRWSERLETFIEQKAYKRSESRNHILSAIIAKAGHFTIQELVRELQASHSGIGAATIYRTIPLLLEAGIIQESLTNSLGQNVYELAETDHHDHVVCLDCGHIFEFQDAAIEKAQLQLGERMKFDILHHRHVLSARCELLKKGGRGTHR